MLVVGLCGQGGRARRRARVFDPKSQPRAPQTGRAELLRRHPAKDGAGLKRRYPEKRPYEKRPHFPGAK